MIDTLQAVAKLFRVDHLLAMTQPMRCTYGSDSELMKVLRRTHPQFEIQLVEATTEIPEKSSRLLSSNKGLNFIAVILDLTYSVLNPQDKIRISNGPRDASDS